MTSNRMHSAVTSKRRRRVAILTIRNVPDELHERLKARAKERRRSLNGEAIECLRLGLATGTGSGADELLARARAHRERLAKRGGSTSLASIAKARKEGRA